MVEGTVFGVYENRTAAEDRTSIPYSRMTIGANGQAVLSVKAGTYYVRELSAPMGLDVSSAIHKVTVNAEQTSNLQVEDTPQMIAISIIKQNAAPEMTAGAEASYSLAGARFGVYGSEADATAGTNAVTVLVTDNQGKASIDGLFPRSYFIKEISAPPHFVASTAIYPIANNVNVPQEVSVPNVPQVAHISIVKQADRDLSRSHSIVSRPDCRCRL
jgi:uncharacterized surface anchored protein